MSSDTTSSTPQAPSPAMIAMAGGGAIAAIAVVALGAGFASGIIGGGLFSFGASSSDYVLLDHYDDGSVDGVELTRWGVDDAEFVPVADLVVNLTQSLPTSEAAPAASGGRMLLVVLDRDTYALVEVDPTTGEMSSYFESEDLLATWLDADTGTLVVRESGDDGQTCYLGSEDEGFSVVADGDWCGPSETGAWFESADYNDDGTVDLEYTSFDRRRILQVEALSSATPLWDDAAVAVVTTDGEFQTLDVYEMSDGALTFSSDRAAAAGVLDSIDGWLLYATADDEGQTTLWRVREGGEPEEVMTSIGSIRGGFAGDEDHIVVVTQADDEEVLSQITVGEQAAQIGSGDYVGLRLAPDSIGDEWVASIQTYDTDGDEAEFWVNVGGEPMELSLGSDAYLDDAVYADDGSYVYLVTSSEYASVTAVNLKDGTYETAFDDWEQASLAKTTKDGAAILVGGIDDGGDRALVLVSATGDTDLVSDDVDSGAQWTAQFTDDQQGVIFESGHGDEDSYTADTLVYEIGSGVRAETVFSDYGLRLAAWQSDAESGISYESPMSVEVKVPGHYCEEYYGDYPVASPDEDAEGYLRAGGSVFMCIEIEEPGDYTVRVYGEDGLDSRIYVEGPAIDGEWGYDSWSNDDFVGHDAGFEAYMGEGAYYVEVWGYSDFDEGDFTLSIE